MCPRLSRVRSLKKSDDRFPRRSKGGCVAASGCVATVGLTLFLSCYCHLVWKRWYARFWMVERYMGWGEAEKRICLVRKSGCCWTSAKPLLPEKIEKDAQWFEATGDTRSLTEAPRWSQDAKQWAHWWFPLSLHVIRKAKVQGSPSYDDILTCGHRTHGHKQQTLAHSY